MLLFLQNADYAERLGNMTSSPEESKIISLINKKKTILKEILRLTATEPFTGNDETIDRETERFISLYEKRDKLVNELSRLQAELKDNNFSAFETSESGEGEAVWAIVKECDELLKQIQVLDNKNKDVGKTMATNVRKNIKLVNQGRNMSLLYSGNRTGTDGLKINAKN